MHACVSSECDIYTKSVLHNLGLGREIFLFKIPANFGRTIKEEKKLEKLRPQKRHKNNVKYIYIDCVFHDPILNYVHIWHVPREGKSLNNSERISRKINTLNKILLILDLTESDANVVFQWFWAEKVFLLSFYFLLYKSSFKV